VEEEGVVPAGAFDLATGRAVIGVGAQDVEGAAAQAGEVLGRVILAGMGAVFVENDVQDPVQTVVDLPVRSYDFEEARSQEDPREEKVAGCGGGPAACSRVAVSLPIAPRPGKW
jgi:hypothetical protein